MEAAIRRNRYFGVFGDGTRLAMPKTRLRVGLIVIEAWFRGYWGVLDKGVSGQPDYILWPDCWTMEIQD